MRKTYRVMARQETGEEICLGNGLTLARANRLADKGREEYPEFYGFTVEREIDYYEQARRQYDSEEDY